MYKKILTSLFLLLTLTMSAAFAENAEVFTISAYGEGEIAAAPDMASVVLSVKNNAGDVKAAQTRNAEIANRVILSVKAQGIVDKDIKTTRYSIRPIYDNNNKIKGYSAENSVALKIRNINKVGEIIDTALAAGANQVSSINFGISNTKNLEREALALAVKNAREQANVTAGALGVTIIGVKHATPNVRRQSFDATPMLMKAGAMRAENSATPIESGEVTVHANVNVEFIIK